MIDMTGIPELWLVIEDAESEEPDILLTSSYRKAIKKYTEFEKDPYCRRDISLWFIDDWEDFLSER